MKECSLEFQKAQLELDNECNTYIVAGNEFRALS